MICIEKNNKFLLLKRSKNDIRPNLLEFPGGSVNLGESLEKAAKRELWEETRLKMNSNLYCGKIERFDRKNNTKTIIHLFLSKDFVGRIKLSKEHSDYVWLRKRKILKMKPSKEISIDVWNFLKNKNFDILRKVHTVIIEFSNYCRKNIGRNIIIMLIGSYSRGEAIPIWSDLDIVVYIPIKGKPLPLKLLKKLREGVLKVQENIKIPIWLKIHTEKTFFGNLSLDNLLNFYHEGIIVYGKDIKKSLKKYIKKVREEDLKKMCKNILIKNVYRIRYFYTGINKNNKEIGSIHLPRRSGNSDKILAAQIIDKIIEITQYSLLMHGKNIVNREDAVKTFKQEFKNFPLKNIPLRMYELRKKWNDLEEREIKFILNNGPKFSERFLHWLSKNKEV